MPLLPLPATSTVLTSLSEVCPEAPIELIVTPLPMLFVEVPPSRMFRCEPDSIRAPSWKLPWIVRLTRVFDIDLPDTWTPFP